MKYLFIFLIFFFLFVSCDDTKGNTNDDKRVGCSVDNPDGICEDTEKVCYNGVCVFENNICEPECNDNQFCLNKECFDSTKKVECIDDAPENATSKVIKVEIGWDTEKERWDDVPICLWYCNDGYKINESEDGCVMDNSDSCNGVECPDNSICNEGKCVCDNGFEFDESEENCIDIDECLTNNGGCEQNCTNTEGGFSCSCNGGYVLNADGKSCDDIDECLTNNGGCEQNCTNTEGGFSCSCNGGYVLNADGKSCDDIDECLTNNGGCEQNCTNTEGGFSCSCNDGYVLNADGKSCDDIDECLTNNGGCEQNCTNTEGGFSCSCNDGYVLNADGKSCDDIDECFLGTDNCDDNATCTNTEGGFTCECNDGYQGDGVICNNPNNIRFITFNLALGAKRCYSSNPVTGESCPSDCSVDCNGNEKYCVKQLLKKEDSIYEIAVYLHSQFEENEKGIIFLQEVNTDINGVNILEVLKNEFGGDWEYTFFSPEGNTYGIAIFSNILHTKKQLWQLPVSDGEEKRGAIALKMKLNGKFVWVVNTHLGLTTSDRVNEIEEIKNKYLTFSQSVNVLIAGDFNITDIYNHGTGVSISSEDTEHYEETIQELIDSGLHKLNFKDSESRKYSFHSWNSVRKGRTLDYIFWLDRTQGVFPEISTLRPGPFEATFENSYCSDYNNNARYLSDHNGLMIKYDIFE